MEDSTIIKSLREQFHRNDQCANSQLSLTKHLENFETNLFRSVQISQKNTPS